MAVLGAAAFCAASGAAAMPAASAQPAAPGAKLGVTVGKDGWITYTTTRYQSLKLSGVTRSTVQGKKSADGTCTIGSSGTAAAGSPSTYQEETAYNPVKCQSRIVTGKMSAAVARTLEAPAADSSDAKSRVGPMSAAATQYSSAYEKTSWIDPIRITITSLTTNLKWPLWGAGGWLYGRNNPYEFRWDGWKNSGTPKVVFHPVGPINSRSGSGWKVNAAERFTNVDFERYVILVLGPSGWAACGFNTAPAHFNHNVTVGGYRNNWRSWAYSDSKRGGCSNLVHHGQWNGWGWSK
ncbi:hypothetical protein [Actinomadura rupiterrae]|uniref:hypothetical protein n=1 Tax=Actinomadura rupiterrae TaxID=559627 RepID=UPI0020A43069|nr:hypothetical protein [Actinomadura rupiterrae]MCP2343841.1 hypothetical protein [Actinomadura rupiterrae]